MVNKLLKTFSAGLKNPGIKLGYAGTGGGVLFTGVYCAATGDFSVAPYFLLGPGLLFGFTVYNDYDVGRRKLAEEEGIQ